jgi:mRNA-degrading endonuclease RelE of RelBE toxin-antitoxin system
MKIRIFETQLQYIKKNLEEEYPKTWDIEYFKSLKSFRKRMEYCNQNLRRISSGSSRIVYQIDDEKVLKLARNRKGLSQNEVEIEYSSYYDISDIVAKVFDSDENNLWVEMELARKVTPKIFQDVTGVSFDEYCNAMKYHYGYAVKFKENMFHKPGNMEDMWENDFVNTMMQFMVNYDIPFGDLCKLTTYGLVRRESGDSIVMIDYGLTEDVFNTHYNR